MKRLFASIAGALMALGLVAIPSTANSANTGVDAIPAQNVHAISNTLTLTTSNLASGANYTSSWVDTTQGQKFVAVSVYADQNGSFTVQYTDDTNQIPFNTSTYTVVGATPFNSGVIYIPSRYWRINYNNGGTATTKFEIVSTSSQVAANLLQVYGTGGIQVAYNSSTLSATVSCPQCALLNQANTFTGGLGAPFFNANATAGGSQYQIGGNIVLSEANDAVSTLIRPYGAGYVYFANAANTSTWGYVSGAGFNTGSSIYGSTSATINGVVTANGALINTVGAGGTNQTLGLYDTTTNAPNPHKYIRVSNGNLQITNSAFNGVPFTLSDSGNLTLTGSLTSAGASISSTSIFTGPVLVESGITNNGTSNVGSLDVNNGDIHVSRNGVNAGANGYVFFGPYGNYFGLNGSDQFVWYGNNASTQLMRLEANGSSLTLSQNGSYLTGSSTYGPTSASINGPLTVGTISLSGGISNGLATISTDTNSTLYLTVPNAAGQNNPFTYQFTNSNYAGFNVKNGADVVVTGLAAPSAPTLGQSVGGTLAATTYYVKITYHNGYGQTTGSTESSLAVPANNVLTVTSPVASGNASGWDVYAGTSTGSETLQSSGIAIGTNWTEPTTGLVSGSALPTDNASIGGLTAGNSNYRGHYATVEGPIYLTGLTGSGTSSNYIGGFGADEIMIQTSDTNGSVYFRAGSNYLGTLTSSGWTLGSSVYGPTSTTVNGPLTTADLDLPLQSSLAHPAANHGLIGTDSNGFLTFRAYNTNGFQFQNDQGTPTTWASLNSSGWHLGSSVYGSTSASVNGNVFLPVATSSLQIGSAGTADGDAISVANGQAANSKLTQIGVGTISVSGVQNTLLGFADQGRAWLVSIDQNGSIGAAGNFYTGSSIYGATIETVNGNANIKGTATIGATSLLTAYDDGTNAIVKAATGAKLYLDANGGSQFMHLDSSDNLTLDQGGALLTGSSTYGATSATINGALTVGSLTSSTIDAGSQMLLGTDGTYTYLRDPNQTGTGGAIEFGNQSNGLAFGQVNTNGYVFGSSTYGATSATVNGNINAVQKLQAGGSPNNQGTGGDIECARSSTTGCSIFMGGASDTHGIGYLNYDINSAGNFEFHTTGGTAANVVAGQNGSFLTGSSTYGATSAHVNGIISNPYGYWDSLGMHIDEAGTATSGTQYASLNYILQNSVWTGTAAQNNYWEIYMDSSNNVDFSYGPNFANFAVVGQIDSNGAYHAGSSIYGPTNAAVNGMVTAVSPNNGTTGAVAIRDASGNPNAAILQFTNNAESAQYAYIKGLSSNGLDLNGNVTVSSSGLTLGSTTISSTNAQFGGSVSIPQGYGYQFGGTNALFQNTTGTYLYSPSAGNVYVHAIGGLNTDIAIFNGSNGNLSISGAMNTDSGNANGLGLQIHGVNVVYSDGGGFNSNLFVTAANTGNIYFGYQGSSEGYGHVDANGYSIGSSTYGPTSETVNGNATINGSVTDNGEVINGTNGVSWANGQYIGDDGSGSHGLNYYTAAASTLGHRFFDGPASSTSEVVDFSPAGANNPGAQTINWYTDEASHDKYTWYINGSDNGAGVGTHTLQLWYYPNDTTNGCCMSIFKVVPAQPSGHPTLNSTSGDMEIVPPIIADGTITSTVPAASADAFILNNYVSSTTGIFTTNSMVSGVAGNALTVAHNGASNLLAIDNSGNIGIAGSFSTGSSIYGPTSASVNGPINAATTGASAYQINGATIITGDSTNTVLRARTAGGLFGFQPSDGSTNWATLDSAGLHTGSSVYGPTSLSVNGQGTFISPNSGTSGGVVIRDAATNPNAAYLQFTNNAQSTQYGYIRGLSTGTGGLDLSGIATVTTSGLAVTGPVTATTYLTVGQGAAVPGILALTGAGSNHLYLGLAGTGTGGDVSIYANGNGSASTATFKSTGEFDATGEIVANDIAIGYTLANTAANASNVSNPQAIVFPNAGGGGYVTYIGSRSDAVQNQTCNEMGVGWWNGTLNATNLCVTTSGNVAVSNELFATSLSITGNAQGIGANVINGDITAERNGITGVIYLGNTGSHYVFFDGSNYQMPNGAVYANAFVNNSRAALKHDIHSLRSLDALAVLNDCAWSKFRYKTGPQDVHYGFIADRCNSLLSGPKKDHFDAETTSTFASLAVLQEDAKVKDLQAQVDSLKKEVITLQAKHDVVRGRGHSIFWYLVHPWVAIGS